MRSQLFVTPSISDSHQRPQNAKLYDFDSHCVISVANFYDMNPLNMTSKSAEMLVKSVKKIRQTHIRCTVTAVPQISLWSQNSLTQSSRGGHNFVNNEANFSMN